MTSSGQMAVQLHELYRVGTVMLPQIADQFDNAGFRVAAASSTDEAFQRDAAFEGGGLGPACAAFTTLRSDIHKILTDSYDNLQLTGEALAAAVEGYAGTDEAIKAAFDAERKEGN